MIALDVLIVALDVLIVLAPAITIILGVSGALVLLAHHEGDEGRRVPRTRAPRLLGRPTNSRS